MSSSREDPRALIRYALVGGALTVALFWMAYLARNALLLVYVAGLVATGLAPLVTNLERRGFTLFWRRRVPRWLAILIIYLSILTILVGIGMLVVPPLVFQARELWAELPGVFQRAQQFLLERGILTQEITFGEAVLRTPVARTDAVGAVIGAIWGFVGGMLGLLTIVILAFYLLVDAENIMRFFVRLFPSQSRARAADAAQRVSAKVSAWLAGQMFLAAVIGTTAALGLYLMGVPYFYVLALIAAFGELIPIVGPLLAAIPAVIVAATVSPALALGVAIFYMAQQQFENHVLVPKVMERQVGISAVMVIVSLLIGGTLLGIVGAILAVPTAGIVQVLYQEIRAEEPRP